MKRLWIILILGFSLAAAGWLIAAHDGGGRQNGVLAETLETLAARAEAGDTAAQFALGQHYRRGEGVPRNPAQAIRWLERAAEGAHAEAQFTLGQMYERGEGVRQDYVQAARWYRLAADMAEHPGALFAMAEFSYHGRGIASDDEAALSYYQRAAARGYPAAQYVLGSFHEKGWGLKPDPVQAMKWYLLALPHREAIREINRRYDPLAARNALKPQLNNFQWEEARKLARAWRPAPAETKARLGQEGLPLLPALPADSGAAHRQRVAARVFAFEVILPGDAAVKQSVSLLVEAVRAEEIARICQRGPRIRDAVVGALWRRSAPMREGAVDLAALAARLRAVVEESLAGETVASIAVVEGDVPLSVNEVLRTPYHRVVECEEMEGKKDSAPQEARTTSP